MSEPSASVAEYDLHGFAGIRVLDGTPADLGAVKRQVGPIQARLSREPEITIRFVHRLPTSSIRYVGLDDAAFTDEAFLVVRRKHHTRVKVQIAFDQIGERCEIVCESGVAAVPLLIPIVNLTALAKGILPVHASAFTYRGTGVLVTGWAKGGKTEALLAFMANGAEYVGDEWIYLDPSGQRQYGIPEPIRLWDWHLNDLPQYRTLLGWRDRSRLGAIKLAQRIDRALPERAAGGNSRNVLGRLMPLVERQLFVHMHPEDLFGPTSCRLAGDLDKIFFVVSREAPTVSVEPVAPEEIARRMVFSLQHERLDFIAYYLKYRFAFPEASNALVDRSEELERELLSRALAGKEAYVVYHPYPAPIPALFRAMHPLL